jgi:ATP-binding cassette, subfamily A (ABC1), member 5
MALHYVFSILNPVYIPYSAVYFVDRVYVACQLSSTCAELSMHHYMTEGEDSKVLPNWLKVYQCCFNLLAEVIVMVAGSILHIPIWTLCLRIADIQKSGGKACDIFDGIVVSWRNKNTG